MLPRFAGGFGDFTRLLAVVLQDVVSHLGGVAGGIPQLVGIVL